MLKTERLEKLLDLCHQQGSLSVRQAARSFCISEMTARRDFDELAAAGRVIREHGGIRLPSPLQAPPSELPYFEKLSIRPREKQDIARAACSLIRENDTVFLGPGSTCASIARLLPAIPLRVVTNSLIAFNILQRNPAIEICILGGQYRSRSGSLVGAVTEEMLAPIGIDKCFIGANGVSNGTAFTSNLNEGRLQSLACDRSGERYLVCDAAKIGLQDFYNFCNLERIDALITDASITPEQRALVEGPTRLVVASHDEA